MSRKKCSSQGSGLGAFPHLSALVAGEVLVAVGVSFWHVHGRCEGLFVCEQGRWDVEAL